MDYKKEEEDVCEDSSLPWPGQPCFFYVLSFSLSLVSFLYYLLRCK